MADVLDRALGPLASDQPAVPPEQAVGRRDAGDLPQARTADSVRARRQSAATSIGETQPPSIELDAASAGSLRSGMRRGSPLPAVQPPGQHHQRHLQRGVDYRAQLISRL
jgi:hypothetical protein